MPPNSAPQRQRPNMKTEGEAANAAKSPVGQPRASARRRVPRRPMLERKDKEIGRLHRRPLSPDFLSLAPPIHHGPAEEPNHNEPDHLDRPQG